MANGKTALLVPERRITEHTYYRVHKETGNRRGDEKTGAGERQPEMAGIGVGLERPAEQNGSKPD